MSLDRLIKARIQQQGPISFMEFMQLALYEPYWGYYSTGIPSFGARGDFVTAPELTPLFGQTLAYQCHEVLKTLTEPIIFEFGAGSGRLCVDILSQLEKIKGLPQAYHILEVSASLRQQQLALFEKEIPHLLPRIKWWHQLPSDPFNGVVLANEVLDAMPVHRFFKKSQGLFESYVDIDKEGQLTEVFQACKNSRLLAHLNNIQLPDTYCSEVNLFIEGWLKQCFDMLRAGMVLLIDYGFPRHEYYHPDRSAGTLMCHYRHRAHTNPFIHLGEQDITAHVDFTHVAEAGDAAGFHVAGFTHQASFLLANGLLSLLSAVANPHDTFRAQQAVKLLTQPFEMGELFKVMALTKDIPFPLQGFQWQDKRASL